MRTNTRSALVRGVGTHNGGAELMLIETARRARDLGFRPVVSARQVDARRRADWELGRYVGVGRLGRFESLGVDLLPRPLSRAFDLSSAGQVDLVLDASGFFLGDQWGERWAGVVERQFASWHARSVPIVMLPQAFGPFTSPGLRRVARGLLSHASIIYARDATSYDYVAELLDSTQRLRLAPDFTASLPPTAPDPAQSEEPGRVAVVPNVNILRQEGVTRDRYLTALVQICDRLREAGLEPVLLTHALHGDPALVAEISGRDPRIRIETPPDGLAAKRFLASCRGVIGARYHALASALSCGVPVVGHSWSHKYEALLSDFGWPGHLADPLDVDGSVKLLLDALADDRVPDLLQVAAARIRAESEAMWAEIGGILT